VLVCLTDISSAKEGRKVVEEAARSLVQSSGFNVAKTRCCKRIIESLQNMLHLARCNSIGSVFTWRQVLKIRIRGW
jgi:hypothetical protein